MWIGIDVEKIDMNDKCSAIHPVHVNPFYGCNVQYSSHGYGSDIVEASKFHSQSISFKVKT